jgi:hypothetical protein
LDGATYLATLSLRGGLRDFDFLDFLDFLWTTSLRSATGLGDDTFGSTVLVF